MIQSIIRRLRSSNRCTCRNMELRSELRQVFDLLLEIREEQKHIITHLQELKRMDQAILDVLDAIDTETTAIGTEVADLQAQIKTSMSPADVQAVKDRLGNISTKLQSIAADPNNPVPNPTPTP